MNLLKFWPKEADCLECIKPEAENPSDAVFLAVHQEMRLVRKSFQTDQAEEKTQNQILEEFLRDEPSGRVILPILGESGIGKSHLVRWLDVQLRQRDDLDRRHVIRIPKSSSLKSVLGRILDGLEGPRYEEIRNQLKAAREQMDEIGAKQRIRAELLAAIERRHAIATEHKATSKIEGSKLSHEDKMWDAYGCPNELPALLTDPSTQTMFMAGTSRRPGIISELAKHVTRDKESPRLQFTKEDFIPGDLCSNSNWEPGPKAKRVLEKLNRETSSKYVDDAVVLLNQIVDDAIAPLATPPDTSLAELFYEVRRQLLAEGRELVLLVEDFAVLAGVQRALLDAIVREGEVGGKKEACTIRTALAVTDGYFGNLETVKTRAIHGWWIVSGEEDNEEIVTNQIEDFVAAYLNASRIGAKRLEKHYEKQSNIGKKAPNAMEFLDPEPDELALLASFGQSADSYCLFPFNHTAISTIADCRLRNQQGRLKFHPRSVINEIILPVVKDARVSFERGTFPPDNFLGFLKTRISTDLSTEVSRKESDPQRQEQYLYLLHFWAGQPEKLSEAILPAGVYQAFGLSLLDGSKTAVMPEALRTLSKTDEKSERKIDTKVKEEPVVEREPLPIRQFIESLETWRGGGVLGQGEANKIRTWINTHILHSINWEAELLRSVKPSENNHRTIYLPRAKGNPPKIENAFVVVASDEQFEDVITANDVFSSIRAMLRYDHYNGWDYEQADDDYVALMNFVDRHRTDAAKWIHAKCRGVDGFPVPSLTQSLLWQARLLNVVTAHRFDDSSQIDAVFADAPVRGDADDDQQWNEFLGELSLSRKMLQHELLERVAAFQGTGKTPHAVDASQLLGVIQEFRKVWKVSEKFPQLIGGAPDEIKGIEKHINLIMRYGSTRIEERRKRIAEQSKLVVAELGKNFDKNELLKDLEEVCVLSEQRGLRGEISVEQIRKLAEKFNKTSRLREVSEQVENIVLSDDLPTRMTALARLDTQTCSLLVEFSETCSKFLQERAGKAQGQILAWTEEVVEMKKAEIESILNELEDAVVPFGEENE